MELSQELALSIINSSETFPLPFNAAWVCLATLARKILREEKD